MKMKYPINTELLLGRLQDIEGSISRLEELRRKFSSKENFLKDKDGYGIVEHHLRRALEGLLSCGSHILSRIPGAKFDEYATISLQLAEHGIIPKKFKDTAIKMAKYRNRLVHFYHEVSKEELFTILQNYLDDLKNFHYQLLKFTESHSKSAKKSRAGFRNLLTS